MSNVLFICVANSGRSVMGERIFRKLAGDRHAASSAGSDPGDAPHPVVVEALKEIGIDATDHIPQKLNADALKGVDLAVAVCSEEQCPITPGVERINWNLPDPKNRAIEEVREIRDEIQRRVADLLKQLDDEAL
jgi:arsenate reductase